MKTKLFIITLFAVAICFSSCKKEDEKPIPDPEGTIECSLGLEECKLLFMNCIDDDFIEQSWTVDIHVNLLWMSPDDFSMTISGYYHEAMLWILDLPHQGYGTFNTSIICNVGRVRGLGDITEIPEPECFDNKLYSHAGYGYVIKFPYASLISDIYVRMYVVGPIRDDSGEIIGLNVKYQYPFIPDNAQL